MLRTAWRLARKDLVLFVRDRTALLLTLALPIALATIFGSAMAGMTGGGGGGDGAAPRIDLVVEDRDGSPASRALVADLEASEGLDVRVVDDARRPVANGEDPCGLVIPSGYGEALAAGRQPELLLLRDPSQAIAQQVVVFQLGPVLLQRTFDSMGAGMMGRVLELVQFPEAGRSEAEGAMRSSFEEIERVVARLEAEGGFGGSPGAGVGAADATPELAGFDPLEELPKFLGLVSEDVAGTSSDGGPSPEAGVSHAFAAMAVMMLLFSVVGAGGTILEERDEGTLQRLQLAPGAGRAVLLGKLLMVGAAGLLQIVVLFAYGAVVFGVPVLEHLGLLTVTSVVWVFSATGLGLLFATICSTRKQLEGISTLVILVMSAVGGAWFPREVTPDWFQTVGSFTIVAWAMDAYHGVLWYGKGLLDTAERSGIWRELSVLLMIGAVLLALSVRLYRRRYEAV